MSSEEPRSDSPNVPWPNIVKFIRQLGHDIRNNLNAVELQSAYLAELANESELKGEVKRLREMVSEIGVALQKLSAALGETGLTIIPYPAADLVEDVKQKLSKDFPDAAPKVSWDVQLKNEKLQIDPLIAQQALLELFANAFHHERNVKEIKTKAYVDGGNFVFELREAKAKFEISTANWGREPLRYLSHGHYGLGLNRIRLVVEAHRGTFGADYDRTTSTLVSKVTFPIAKS
jgi:light-regulated signal transduction histidine kinase (bacteriophytochrome)